MESKKKLIEVSLPLEAINAEAAREKSIRHGHPSTLHLWWARRPLAAARAVIWSSLVDDPSAHPEEFPTEEAQEAERQRLFDILTQLVKWENSNNEAVLDAAKAEILKSTDGNPPALLDPFAGGGAIPLEAQRLGLEAHASDLNPVAVMINKAMIEIPPMFAGRAPVNPDSPPDSTENWAGAAGLAEDVRYYGEWMKQEAFKRIGHLYPKVKVPAEQGGGEATVIAWIWARTVKCPNPACGCEMPLVRSFDLSKKKGYEAHVEPSVDGTNISYRVCPGKSKSGGTVIRTGTHCLRCGQPVGFDYIRSEGQAGRIGSKMIAVVAEGEHGRIYITPDEEQISHAVCPEPDNCPEAHLPLKALGFRVQAYGMIQFKELFTNRQLTALTTFSGLVSEAQAHAEMDAKAAGLPNDSIPLADGGTGAKAYGQALGVYLACAVNKSANLWSSICGWMNDRGAFRETFARQAIPMVWDFAEANPFSNSGGNFDMFIDRCSDAIAYLPQTHTLNSAIQFDAQSDNGLRNIMVSTDPPYYDNIGYADLSDFFYVWMRRSLKETYPELFKTMLVPKAEELVATPYRFDGSVEKARDFFEDGMLNACRQMYVYAREDIPVTIYFAYKQSDTDEDEQKTQTSSTGWETMLNAIVLSGFSITGTWPIRTESPGRSIAQGTNALASSIVLVCRKRPADAPTSTRRDFVNALKRELRPALAELQRSNIAPVDLAQAAIGPGMGVYSRFAKVLDADGTPMSVRNALQIINQELDSYFNEQDGELDRDSRFCVELYSQSAFNTIKFGDANILAQAKNTSIAAVAEARVVEAEKGFVRLLTREELPERVNGGEHVIWLLTQQLTREMERGGIDACAAVLKAMHGANVEYAKALAYRLYTLADRRGWTAEAYAYNALVVAWPDIQSRAAELQASEPEQLAFDGFGGKS